ncbi:MAG: uroporphyrinogen-III synthase [Gemmatimonadota bacterium]
MKPLAGHTVATTRAMPDPALTPLLVEAGAKIVAWASMEVRDSSDPERLHSALGRVESFDWVAFTSARAVESVRGLVDGWPPDLRIAAVGPSTARAAEAAGWPVSLIGRGGAAELATGMASMGSLRGTRVLFPAGSMASNRLEEGLRTAGAIVTRVEAYVTRPLAVDRNRVMVDLARGVAAVTFASPSAVAGLADALGTEWPTILDRCGLAAIGETTAHALFASGVERDRVTVAEEPTFPALVVATTHATRHARTRGTPS